MIIAPGVTSQSITIQIVDDSGLAVLGLVAATFPTTSYERVKEAIAGITLSDLALITTAYASGGVKEVGGGYYRLDVPNAAFATESLVRIVGEASGLHIIHQPIQVVTPHTIVDSGTITTYTGNTPQTGDSFARIGATGSGLTTLATQANVDLIKAVTNKVDTALVLDGSVYQYTANALELGPTGSTPPTVGAIADAVWDELLSGHVGAGSAGLALSDAGVAGNPLDGEIEPSGSGGPAVTLKECMRLVMSFMFGLNTVGVRSATDTQVYTFRDINDELNRVTMEVDSRANRITVTRDVS